MILGEFWTQTNVAPTSESLGEAKVSHLRGSKRNFGSDHVPNFSWDHTVFTLKQHFTLRQIMFNYV